MIYLVSLNEEAWIIICGWIIISNWNKHAYEHNFWHLKKHTLTKMAISFNLIHFP